MAEWEEESDKRRATKNEMQHRPQEKQGLGIKEKWKMGTWRIWRYVRISLDMEEFVDISHAIRF